MMHVTFKSPHPRIVVMQRSVAISAVNALHMEYPSAESRLTGATHVELHCVSFVRVDGDRDVSMKTRLVVALDHIASVVGQPEADRG